jgi:PST family polysaccharide transporter
MSLRAQAAKGLKWQAIEIGGRQVLSLVVFTTLARLLNPSDFGLVGLVGVYLAFVGMFVDQGLGTAIIQRKELESGHLDAAFWFGMACAALLCAGTLLLARPVASFFAAPALAPLLRWASLALVINASAGVHHTLFFRGMDFRRPAIRTLVGNLVGGAVGVAMALAGCGVWSLIGQQLTAAFAGAVFLWMASSWRPRLAFSLARLRELMVVSASVFSVSFLWFFSSRLDQIVIGRFLGAGVLGQYVIGAKLPDLAKTAVQAPVGAIAMPALSQLQHDHSRMREAIYKGMELNALVTFAVFGGLAAVAPTLVPLVFGEQWRPAAPMLRLLSIYALVLGLFVYCHPALLASGGVGKYVFVNIACASGAALACFLGVRWGTQAIILGLIANLSLTGLLALLFLKERMGLSPWRYCKPCILPGLAAAAMCTSVWLVHRAAAGHLSSWADLIGQVLSGAMVYSAGLLLLAPASSGRLWKIVQYGALRSPEVA